MPKTLLIDFDGTICHDRFWFGIDQTSKDKVSEFLHANNHKMIIKWMKGKITSEEINKEIAKLLKRDEKKLWQEFVKSCYKMKVNKNLLNKINKLRKTYQVVLLTDNMDSFDRFVSPNLKLEKYFDKIINSFNEGNIKGEPNGKLFKKTLKTMKVPIKDAILFDNSKLICKLFKALGGKSHLVTKEKPIEFHLNKLKI